LCDVFGIGASAQELAGEVIGGVETGQDQSLEPRLLMRVQHVSTFLCDRLCISSDRRRPGFIPTPGGRSHQG